MSRSKALRTRVALAAGLVLLALAVGVTLTRSPAVVAGSNSVEAAVEFAAIHGHFAGCQDNEVLPRHTDAIRVSLDSVLGPRVTLRALAGRRLLTYGERGAGWTAADVTIPVRPVTHTTRGVALCLAFQAEDESVGLTGERVPSGKPSGAGLGLLKVEYLAPGQRSWWSLASSIVTHMAFGHAWPGAWIVPFLLAMMATVIALVCWLARGLER
jgi:hypothetical protein